MTLNKFKIPDPDNREFNRNLPLITLLKRETLRFTSVSIQTIITPMVTASLYLLIFGLNLGTRISLFENISYLEYVIPGLILMGIIQNSFSNSASSLFQTRYMGSIVDFLVTPLTPAQFILAFTIAAMLRGLTVGLAILIVSSFFITLSYPNLEVAIIISLISSFLFSQFGIIAALYSNSFDKLAVFTNFILTPLIYLGGLFFPVSSLSPFWKTISLINPIYYIMNLMHYGCLGINSIPIWISFSITIVISLLLFLWSVVLIRNGRLLNMHQN